MAKVLVTGGSGFIGSNLVLKLRESGHETWSCDIVHSPDIKSTRCDVREFRQVEKVFDKSEFEIVYHLAAEYGRWNGEEFYENLWSTNASGTKNIVRIQEERRFRMVFFSSAEVYGDYDGLMKEDVMTTMPIVQMNDYAMSKWVGEMQVMNSASTFGTETVRVRPFNVYGPGEHYHSFRGFVPRFIYMGLHDLPYTVYIGHTRTLEYVDDIVIALCNVIDNFKSGEVYNLGGDKQYEVKEVSDMVLSNLGKTDSKVTYKDAEPFTTKLKQPDSTKAKRDLGFRQRVSAEEGIAKTVEWFRTEYGRHR